MSSFPNTKIDPVKYTLLENRLEGEGGVPSSFTPPRISSEISYNDSHGDVSRLTEASQSSCKTIKCANVASIGDMSDPTLYKEDEDNKDEASAAKGTKKKKSTPNKRPASAISLTKTSNSARKEQEKSRKAKSSKLQSEPNDKEYNVGLAPSSASRDTILGYFPSASNPPKTAGTTLGNSKLNTTSPAVVAKSKVVGSSNSRLSTTSPAMPKASSGSGSRLAASTSPVPSKPSSITETAKSNGQKKIDRYFGVGKANSNNFSKEKAKQIQSLQKSDLNDEKQTIKSVLSASETSSQHLHEKIASLEKQLAEATSQNLAIKNNQTMLTLQLQATVKRQSIEIQQIKSDSEQGKNKATNIIEELIRKDSIQKSVKLRQTLASDGARLGRLVTTRRGGISRAIESWEDGEEPLKLKKRRAELKKRRKTLEQRWGELTRDNFDIGELVGDLSNDKRPMDDLEKFEARETIRMHLDELKRDERKLDEEDMACTLEKRRHVRTLKLVSNEDTSRFRFRQKLHDRYVPLNILGKGGFSEVWQAYDLQELRRVAVKIHQLEPSWSDAKKENYTKHVSREYEIHREVRHPRIVSLYDVFEIDTDSFATVLECCDGDDLDTILKDRGRLVERDARAILLQVLSGMRYLSTQSEDGKRQGIIHYDLKPGNILFDDDGRAKITDFGLSKIVDSGDYDEGMELTSQGAGTYWYLPPECFLMDQDVRISNKVDVWSIGVIYFQMLFGRRPFGEGESQDKVLRNQTVLHATEVLFPAKPLISEGAKEFIRTCLTYDQLHRPNVSQLCEHQYLRSALPD